MEKELFEQMAKEIASAAWKSAANAYRMYPNSKHTFIDYWSDYGKRQFDALPKMGSSSTPPQEVEAEGQQELWDDLVELVLMKPRQMISDDLVNILQQHYIITKRK